MKMALLFLDKNEHGIHFDETPNDEKGVYNAQRCYGVNCLERRQRYIMQEGFLLYYPFSHILLSPFVERATWLHE